MIRREQTIALAPALLLAATAIVTTPAAAQDAASAPAPAAVPPPVAVAPPAVTPPRVVPTVPETSNVTQGGRAPTGSTDAASPTPVNPAAAAQAEAEDAERRAAARRPAARPVARRPERAAVVAAGAPAAAPAPIATPAPAPSPAPTPSQSAAPSAADSAPEAPVADNAVDNGMSADTTAETADTPPAHGAPLWPWILGAIVILGGVIAFFLRRRNAETEVWDEPAPVEPAPIAAVPAAPVAPVAPVAPAPAISSSVLAETPAEPVTADDATLVEAAEEDVAALTAAAPVGDRPWLEFALRPLRAGTNVDEALVEIELTVGNAGQVAAEDVRIATIMLESDLGGELDRLLGEAPAETAVDPVTIAPGEGTRVDATLALLKVNMASADFLPIVVADARYRLADGGEGRTSAAFRIGLPGEGGVLVPMTTERPLMHDEVEAQLYRDPEHR